MGKKKFFIDKSKCVTFKLQPAGNQRPTFTGDPELNNIVEVTEDELQEREKYGVYFNDNYNYLYHLKSKDDPIDLDVEETAQINLPVEAIRQPVAIKEVKGREVTIGSSQLGSSSFAGQQQRHTGPQLVDLDPDLDADLLSAMEAAEAGQIPEEGEDFDLDDNFLELAGGVDEPEARRVFEQFRKTNPIGSDSEDEEGMDDDGDYEGEDFDDEDADEEQFKTPTSIMKSADKAALDERFNHFYEHMNDDEDDEFDEGEEFAGDDGLLDDFANEYQEHKDKVYYEKPDEESKKLTLAAFEKQETSNEEMQKIEVPLRQKRAKWDCESIVSTYSNIYNHPTIIREQPKRKDTQLSRKAMKHTDVEMRDETASVRSAFSSSTFRPRGETAEERRERKNAIKAERRERRQEKKANKDVFKQEKKRLDAQRGAVQVSGRRVS